MKKIRLLFLTLVALMGGPSASADTWTVAGVEALMGANWVTDASVGNDMTFVEGANLWKLTKTYETPLAAGSYEYKVVQNHSWDNISYPEQGNRILTVDAPTNVVTFWYDVDYEFIYATYCYSIIGNLWDNWTTDKDMTQDATNPYVYTLVVDNFEAEAKNYEFKLRSNHDWDNYQIPFDDSNKTWTCSEAGKYKLTFTANVVEHTLTLNAEPELNNYVCDFNTAIATSDHAFQVASNWRHIVDTYEDYWGDASYASYSYSTTAGVDGSGALSCSTNQSSNSIYDLLVTPVVKGTVTIAAKATASYYTPQLTFFKITDNGDGTFTRGDQITVDISAINATDYTTITIPVDEAGERIGIRSSYVWLDNFSATEATIIPEAKITIASADPTATTGTIYWNQQPNGKVLVSYTVTVTNTGEVDLKQGDEGFSISIFNRSTGDVYATVAVPQDLAVGDTSDEFVVSAEVETTLWPNSYTYINMDLKENVFGTVVQRAQSHYKAYESKFVFREAGSTATSSISSAQNWGTITESTSKNYEVANLGNAPLTITAYAAPAGFTLTPGFNPSNMPEGVTLSSTSVVMQGGAVLPFTVTQDATAMGTYSGTLTIGYQVYGAESTTDYTLGFSATVIGENTWTADFNNSTSTVVYPEGSIAEGGINKDYQYISSGNYNNWLVGRNGGSYNVENNRFITPKLHANAGDKLAFDVKAGYSTSDDYFVKVYVSTDRKTWGDPVETYVYSNVGSSFTTKSISFDAEGDYYVAFAIYGSGSGIDNLVGLEKVAVAHDLYIKSVNWPDASIKSGTAQTKPSVDIIPLTNETADAYTVKYIYGDNVVNIDSKALTASASSTTSFSASFTPEVATTTTFPGTKVVFEFTDGTKFETETFDLTVTNEPKFHFLSSKQTSRWYEPSSDYTTPYNFGKNNVAGSSKTFWILNWGSAPLTVKSIAVPEGFTSSVSSMDLPAFDGTQDGLNTCQQSFDITFSATEAGDYSGNLVVTYVNGAGENATFELALSGTMLDPSKFYANFGSESNQWPAGSVYQDNVSTTYVNTGDYAITSSNDTKNIFVTPKLTATDGEKLMFDAKLYNSYSSWSGGKVVVYAAATREEVLNAEEGTTRKQLFSVSGQDETNPMTTDFQTFEVPAVAGDNYYAFEISNRPYVDEIYGLTQTAVEHDWTIASSNIPAEAMQNYSSTATVNILNLGLQDEAAEDITVTAYVNGEAVATAEGVSIPMNHKLSDAGTQLSVNYMSTVAGTFPVYVEVKAGGYSIATDPVEVTFAEEVAMGDAIQVGTVSGRASSNAILDFYNLDGGAKTGDIVYTAAQLNAFGITAGSKIVSIAFKGYASGAKTISNSLTAWVGLKTGDITWNSPDKSTMTEINIFDGSMPFVNGENLINVDLTSSPIVYDGTSDLRVYFEGTKGGWITLNFDYDSNYMNMRWGGNSTAKANPIAYLTLEAQSATLAGTVKNSSRNAIAGATVTLKAENGVQYTGTTDATGAYSINVIQAGLDFTATVEAENYLKNEFAYNLGGESKTLDVTLYQSFGIVGSFPGFDWENDQVMTQSTEDPNVFTLVVEDVELEAKMYEYKLRADGIWKTDGNDGYQLPNDGSNNNWEFNLAGTYTLKFTANVSEHTLTVEPTFILEKNAAVIAGITEDADLDGVIIASERQFKAGWNAIYLPVNVSAEEVTALFGANAEIAYYAGDEADANGNVTVKFNKRPEGSIEAGVPYLLWSDNAVSGFELTGREIKADKWSTTGTTFDFVGTYSDVIANAGDYFIAGGKFVKATTNNTVLAFRSYLKLKDTSLVRSINFVIGDEEATAIEGLTVERTNDAIYNLNGQKVQQPTKRGLYIINGKKVMVK